MRAGFLFALRSLLLFRPGSDRTCQEGFQPALKGPPRQEHAPSASQAFEPNIGPDANHSPLIAAARVDFAQTHDIVNVHGYRHYRSSLAVGSAGRSQGGKTAYAVRELAEQIASDCARQPKLLLNHLSRQTMHVGARDGGLKGRQSLCQKTGDGPS